MVVVPRGEPHLLLSRPDAQAVPFRQALAEIGKDLWAPGDRIKPFVMRAGGGRAVRARLVAGVFELADKRRNPMLTDLPALLVLRHRDVATLPG